MRKALPILACLVFASSAQAGAVPEELVIPPARYGGRDLRQPGPHDVGRGYRIVFDGTPRSIISGLATITRHQGGDDFRSPEELAELGTRRRLRMTCGPISYFAKHLLEAQGVDARIIYLFTKDEWRPDYVGDGHVLLEARARSGWHAFDTDMNFQPYIDGRPATMVDLLRPRGRNLSYQWLAPPEGRPGKGYYRPHFSTPPRWYRNFLGTGLIEAEGTALYYYMTRYHSREEVAARARYFNGSYNWLPRPEFMQHFYP
jgi:hypothetical protein